LLARSGVGLALALPAFFAFGFVYRFGVDVPFWDEWELVNLLQRGHPPLADLFAQHNEHRIFFPRLVMFALARLTAWDSRAEMWFGWGVVLSIGVLLFLEHLKAFGRSLSSAALFIPCAWVVFSLRQDENLLWGWQIQITMCSLALCGSMALLDSSDRNPTQLAGAIACGVVSCFSFAAGLAVWPAGVICLLARRPVGATPELRAARRRTLSIWITAGTLAVGLYLTGYVKPGAHPSLLFLLEHPTVAAYYFTANLGGALATGPNVAGAAAAGVAVLGLLGMVAGAAWLRAVDMDKAAFGLSLSAFALATCALVTIGRSGLQIGSGGVGAPSRYTTLTLLGTIGAYRCCLALRDPRLRLAAASAATTMIFLGTFVSMESAPTQGAQTWRARTAMQAVLLDWRRQPDAALRSLYPSAQVVRERALILEELGLTVFRSP
jgi:hypothetical protein